MQLTVKKNFATLLEGDLIEVMQDLSGKVYFSVINRTKKVRFYGNKKGKWSKENPIKKGKPSFFLVKENVPPFNAMVFDIPLREPHPTKDGFAAEGTENWDIVWKQKVIDDFKKIGVF